MAIRLVWQKHDNQIYKVTNENEMPDILSNSNFNGPIHILTLDIKYN